MYRLRSTKSLFKYNELEKQLIYFSSVNNEDDMYEGKYVLFFDGNRDLWEGLIVMLYEHIVWNVSICGPEYKKYQDNAYLPGKIEYAERVYDYSKEDIKRLLNLKSIKELINNLSNEKIYENIFNGIVGAMITRIFIINSYISREKIFKDEYSKNKHIENMKKMDNDFLILIKSLKEISNEINISFSDASKKISSINILSPFMALDSEEIGFKNAKSTEFLISTFFNGLRNIALEECYIASFTSKYNDSRMWSQYTEYDGICLEFKSNDSIKLRHLPNNENETNDRIIDSSVNKIDSHKFKKVIYDRPPEFNFFNVIGKLSGGYFKYFFPNYDFKIDPCSVISEVKNKYWERVVLPVIFKDPSWKDQDEYRLIISDFMDMIKNKNDRLYEYEFNELKSVILGSKVSDEDRSKIIKILDKKCKINQIYKFIVYELYRDDNSGKLDRRIYTTLNDQ